MSSIETILARHFTDQAWSISKPHAGSQKEAYIARSAQHTVFVKFDIDARPWHRLARIGATPRMLADGVYQGRPYLVQAFAAGLHPDRAWFAAHIPLLARFIKRYHGDEQLAALLARPDRQSYAQHIRAELATLHQALAGAVFLAFKTQATQQAFAVFQAQATQLHAVPLVPVHTDPSPVNFIVTDSDMTVVDWDDVMLSDPLHDLGLIVWWYLPRSAWQAVFVAYGAAIDTPKIFWWAARRSLELALWLERRQEHAAAQAFLEDFYCAVEQRANPQIAAVHE